MGKRGAASVEETRGVEETSGERRHGVERCGMVLIDEGGVEEMPKST